MLTIPPAVNDLSRRSAKRGRKVTLATCALALAATTAIVPEHVGQTSGAGQRPPIVGVAHIALQTKDLAKARRFYGDLLGYAEVPLQNTPHAAVFEVNDRQRLIIRDALPPDRDERLLDVGFETTNGELLRAHCANRGIAVAAAARDVDAGGTRIAVTDPDGHPIHFVQLEGMKSRSRPVTPDRRISRRILHTGLTVRDVAAADRFYKDILAFSEIWRGGRTPDVTSWINMRVPEGTDYLEYMLVAGPVDRRQLGVLHHAALLVPDVQEALELVRSRAAPDDPNASAIPQIGRNNRWQLNLYDPDGTRIELMEPWTVR